MTAAQSMRVTLKLATSLDGRIALANGQSKWITGPEAREQVHLMRSGHDAILTGIGTVLADDPQLTARPDGVASEDQPRRVVLDSHLRMPADAAMLTGAPVWVFHVAEASKGLGAAELIQTEADVFGRACFKAVLQTLRERGVQSLMIEAGAETAGSAIRSGLVTHIEWFRAPMLIGAEGRACIAGLGLEELSLAPTFQRTSVRACGADLWETYQRG